MKIQSYVNFKLLYLVMNKFHIQVFSCSLNSNHSGLLLLPYVELILSGGGRIIMFLSFVHFLKSSQAHRNVPNMLRPQAYSAVPNKSSRIDLKHKELR